MVLALAACTDDYTDWADPITNAEEDAISISGFTASAADAIDLNSIEADSAKVFNLATGALPEGYTLENVRIELTPDGVENATTTTVALQSNGLMSTADLQTLVENVYGKNPTARTFTGHVYANAIKDGAAVLIDCGTLDVIITPEAPYISEHYYLIGAPSAWDPKETSMPFSHSSSDVYDDPVFTITFAVEDGDTWFAIADDKTVASGEWSDVLGCAEGNGNNGTTGFIKRRSELSDDGSWKISVNGDAKYVRMTLNMMDYSYTLEKLNFAEYIYEIGNNTGWGSCIPLASPNFDGKYTGYAWLDGEFKFKPNEDNWDGDWEMVTGDAYAGTISESGASNISAPDAGFYQMNVDLATLTYSLTAISSISIIGAATGDSSWGTDLDLTYDASSQCWTGSFDLVAGEYKFRANHDWTTSWGGTESNLTTNNGANLSIAAAGTYEFKLSIPCEGKSSVTVTKK